MKRTIIALIGVGLLTLIMLSCGTESVVQPEPEVPVELSVAFDLTTPTASIPGDIKIQHQTRPSGGPDSITVESGLIMLRTFRLHTTPVETLDDNITAADEVRDVNDASVRYHGPVVAQISRSSVDVGDINVPIGAYKQMTFVLQRARQTDDLGDNDELLGSSIRVSGRVWRGETGRAFTFETDYTSEMAVDGDFTVTESMTEPMTLVIQAGNWFHNGGRWLDPNDPADRSQIVLGLSRNLSGGIEGTY